MRILILEPDEHLAEALAAVLIRRGHQVQGPAQNRRAPDAILLGLPAPDWASPRCLPAAPLLVLAGEVGIGEIERWIADRPRWGVMTKPVSERRVARWLDRHCGGGASAGPGGPARSPTSPAAPRAAGARE